MSDKPKHAGGRPRQYSEDIAKAICEDIQNIPRGLDYICEQNPDYPAARTVRKWLLERPEFVPMYARAKQLQAATMADEIIAVANDSEKDWRVVVDNEGNQKEIFVAESVNRSRLKVDALKWSTEILDPHVYGLNRKDKDKDNTACLSDAIIAMKELAEKCMQRKS